MLRKNTLNIKPIEIKKWNQFLDFFRVSLKKLFENKNNEAILFSELVNSSYFWKKSIIHDNWQKNLHQFLQNIGHNPHLLDSNIQKHLLLEQQNMSIKDYHLDDLSFTTWLHSMSIELMIEDLQSYLWSKKEIFLVDIFSWTYSIPGVIIPFQNAFWLIWYLWIDLQDALSYESTQKALLQAEQEWLYTWFLQTDAYSGLRLLPDHSVDVLLINWVDYTITSEEYMWKVMMQAKRILKHDGVIGWISNWFFYSPSRIDTYLAWYHIKHIWANSYCMK